MLLLCPDGLDVLVEEDERHRALLGIKNVCWAGRKRLSRYGDGHLGGPPFRGPRQVQLVLEPDTRRVPRGRLFLPAKQEEPGRLKSRPVSVRVFRFAKSA